MDFFLENLLDEGSKFSVFVNRFVFGLIWREVCEVIEVNVEEKIFCVEL